ncbi:MAG: ABC transporter ATP-binding protein [Candidatus Dormibacteraeota bacterium]|nr:ABC transporter ATP-binding protein [Candidatus Dormibacteraeota bacterium]
MTVAELRGVTKRFGPVEALKGIDLDIAEGELLALLGPNGAGKTTAIGMMLGLRRPTTGTVRLMGLDPADRRARSRCGVMLQESGVNQTLSVSELVNLFRAYYPNPMSAGRAIALAGLEPEAKKPVAKLSGGQKQRLYYALAVAGDPEVIFLDEPTVGMDVESRRTFLDSIKTFAAGGRTIVLTTHYLDEADELAHRIVVVDRGLVVADGTPDFIKSKVAGRRVTFDSDRALTEADFDGLPRKRLEISGQRAKLLTDQPEDVLRALFQRGMGIRNLSVVGADLEEAFLALTAHHKTDAGASRLVEPVSSPLEEVNR